MVTLLEDALEQCLNPAATSAGAATLESNASDVAALARSLLSTLRPVDEAGTAEAAKDAAPAGLSEEAIATLPVELVSARAPTTTGASSAGADDGFATSGTQADACAICLAELEPRQQLRRLPACGHACHLRCMDEWLKVRAQCPLCRAPVAAVRPSPRLNPNINKP